MEKQKRKPINDGRSLLIDLIKGDVEGAFDVQLSWVDQHTGIEVCHLELPSFLFPGPLEIKLNAITNRMTILD